MSKSRLDRCAVVFVLLLILAIAIACSWLAGHWAEAPSNGLSLTQLESALVAEDGFETRATDSGFYRERRNRPSPTEPFVGAHLDPGRGRIEVFVYVTSRRPDEGAMRNWRARLDELVRRVEAVHPEVGNWEYRSSSGREFLWLSWVCMVSLVASAALVGFLIVRSVRRRSMRQHVTDQRTEVAAEEGQVDSGTP